MLSPNTLPPEDLPQADRIERVIELVRKPRGDSAEDTQARDLAYYRHAARILGWLDENQHPTQKGLELAAAAEHTVLHLAARAFACSRVGATWLAWSEVENLLQLDEDSAEDFLAECSACSPSTRERRGSTLKRWLRSLRTFDAAPIDDNQALTRFLSGPIADPLLPTRMLNWAARNNLSTLADLAARDPLALTSEKNLGRKTIADTDSFFHEKTGLDWRALRRRLPELGFADAFAPATTHNPEETADASALPVRELSWEQLARALPEFARELPLTRLELPARMRKFCDGQGLQLLHELLARSSAELRQADNLGRGSIEQTRLLIVDWLEHAENVGNVATLTPSVDAFPDFFTLWRQRLASLSAQERLIITQRIGVLGEAETLETIGALFGVTRERVRQLESTAIGRLSRDSWWIEGVEAHLKAALLDGAACLTELAHNAWFTGLDTRVEEFRYFLKRFAMGTWSIAELLGRAWLSQTPDDSVEAVHKALNRRLQNLTFPVPVAEVEQLIHAEAMQLPARFAGLLYESFQANLHRAEVDGRSLYTGIGDTRRAEVLAFVRGSREPVSVHELEQTFGRGAIPEELVYVRRGAVMDPANIAGFAIWQARLAPTCAALMRQHGPERQWSTEELIELLSPVARIPEWLNAWHLASMLRLEATHVVYLGRLRVCLPESQRESRTYVHDVVRQILLAAGEPLSDGVLRSRTAAETAVTDLAWSNVCSGERGGVVRVSPTHVGLIDRDVPGGEGAFAEATDLLHDLLSQRQRGFSANEALHELRAADPLYAHWTREMVHAVGRSSALFRTAVNGSLGLAEWDDVRVPGQREIVREALERGDGRAKLDDILDRIEQLHGNRPARYGLGNVLISAGAQLRGEDVVSAASLAESTPQPAPALPSLPALPALHGLPGISIDLFATFYQEPPLDVAELKQACLRHVDDFRAAAETNEFVNVSEAEALSRLCIDLLESSAVSQDACAQRLAWAAARYFVTVHDADSDFSIGGLDDDIQVANAVAAYLGHEDKCLPLAV